MARGSREARAAMGVRAHLGAAPRAARNWGLVRPLLPAWPNAPAVIFLAFFTRPIGGIAGEWPSESPTGHPRHHMTSPGTEVRPRGRPPVTQPPQGGLGPEFSQYRPICAPSLPRHSRAPPARAAHPRRPLAPPVRAARSRSPPAPSARAATSPHRHQTLIMISPDFPIPSHLHTPPFMPPAGTHRTPPHAERVERCLRAGPPRVTNK